MHVIVLSNVSFVQAQNQEFESFIHTSLEWIIRTGPDVGIRYKLLIQAELKHSITRVCTYFACLCLLQADWAGS